MTLLLLHGGRDLTTCCFVSGYLQAADFHSGIVGTHFARVIFLNKREMIFRLFFRFRRRYRFP